MTSLARGAHLKAMREDARGFKVLGPRGDIPSYQPTKATDDPASIGESRRRPVLRQAVGRGERRHLRSGRSSGRTTAVIPLQNGIDASERLIPIIGKVRDHGRGSRQISATIAEPGVIRQTGYLHAASRSANSTWARPSARGARLPWRRCQAGGLRLSRQHLAINRTAVRRNSPC